MNEAFDYLLLGLSTLANFVYLWRNSSYSVIKKSCLTIVFVLLWVPIIILPEYLMPVNILPFIHWGFTAYYYSRKMPVIIGGFSIFMLILFYFTDAEVSGVTMRVLLFHETAFQDTVWYKFIWLAFVGLILLPLSCIYSLLTNKISAAKQRGFLYGLYVIFACMWIPWSLLAMVLVKQRGLLAGAIVITVWSAIQIIKRIRHAKDENITN